MGKQMESRFHLWVNWDYEKEEEWLNECSARGFHLERPGPLWSKFSRDRSIRYVYRMDQQPVFREDGKLEEYLELYREAGWEYRGSHGRLWHYFRKPWNQADQQELYTDRTSRIEHYRKIRRMMAIVFLCNLPLYLFNLFTMIDRYSHGHLWTIAVPVIAIYTFLVGLLGYGCLKMNRKIKQAGA